MVARLYGKCMFNFGNEEHSNEISKETQRQAKEWESLMVEKGSLLVFPDW